MTAFDAAWRKEREDAQASAIQAAYDKVDGYQNWQRWFHVAQPIETMMPNGKGIMYRDRIGTNRLVDKEGEYISAEQAMADYLEDVEEGIARKRKNPGLNKDPKYARLFIPNPQSKMKEIGDFHLDEGKSEEWQEKNASEPMTAFDTAWSLLKMPLYHGTYWGDDVEREGLDVGRESSDLDPNIYGGLSNEDHAMALEEIKALFMRDFSEEDWERMMLGDDWKYAAGDTERETANAPAGKLGALAQALAYGSDIFEIDENHPDSPEWIKEPIYQRHPYAEEGTMYSRYAFPKHTIQYRTRGYVPPQTMRRMSAEEVAEAQNKLKNWRQAFTDRRDLMESMMWNLGLLNSLSQPQQAELMRQYKTLEGMGQARATQQEVDDWLRANYLGQYASDGGMANEPV